MLDGQSHKCGAIKLLRHHRLVCKQAKLAGCLLAVETPKHQRFLTLKGTSQQAFGWMARKRQIYVRIEEGLMVGVDLRRAHPHHVFQSLVPSAGGGGWASVRYCRQDSAVG